MKSYTHILSLILSAAFLFQACSYLDVVPDETPDEAGVTTQLDDDHALACFLGYDGKASLNLPTATMFDAMSEDDPAKAVTCTQDGEGYVTAAKWGGVGMDMMGIGVKVTSETIFEFTYAE